MAQQIEFHLLIILAFYFIFVSCRVVHACVFWKDEQEKKAQGPQEERVKKEKHIAEFNLVFTDLVCIAFFPGHRGEWGRGWVAIYGPAEGKFNFWCRPNESFLDPGAKSSWQGHDDWRARWEIIRFVQTVYFI